MRRFFAVLVLAILSTLSFFAWGTVRVVKEYQIDMGCYQYIKRAADASSVDVAKRELGKAIEYAEENGLTEGIVSIFLKQPKNDVAFWYENMKVAYAELEALPEDSTPLEKTNVLMKVREALTDDDGDGGVTVTKPDGLDIYPNNSAYFWWATLSIIALIVFWIMTPIFYYDYY